MNKKRKILCILGIFISVMLSGCARIDASMYVQAVLDTSYKGETDQYIKVIGGTKEEAQEIFQKKLNATMKEFKTTQLSEELEKQYEILFGNLMKQMNYQVGEAEKEKRGRYIVKVIVKPVLLFDETYEEFQRRAEEYAKEITEQVTKNGEMPEETVMQQEVYRIYYEVLEEQLEAGVSYGDSKAVILHVIRQKDGTYEIAKQDLITLDAMLISQAVLTRQSSNDILY